jgi:hypothetical protein
MNPRRISELSERLEYLRACEHVAKERTDGKCWVPLWSSLTPAQLREHDGNFGSLAQAMDRSPVTGDLLMSRKEISAECTALEAELRKLVAR